MNAAHRIDMRVDEDTKRLAERASAASGKTVSQYLSQLVRENAPKILEETSNIRLRNEKFDNFADICSRTEPMSQKILETAKRLDQEGY